MFLQHILNSIFLLQLILGSTQVFARASSDVGEGVCGEWSIKVVSEMDEKFPRKVQACFNYETGSLISMDCKKRECEAKAQLKKIKKLNILDRRISLRGNPLFKVCFEMGGRAELVKINEYERVYNRCQFQDNSFIDLGRIQRELNRISP